MKKRDRLLSKFIKSKNPSSKASLHTEYKEVRNNVTELIRLSKLSFYKSYFSANSKNLRKVWQGIKSIINIKHKANDTPACIYNENGELITDPLLISKTFCDQYTNVAQNILNKRKFNGDGNFEKFMPSPCTNSIANFPPVDREEIEKLLKNINPNKSTGPSSIPAKFLFYMSDSLIEPLSIIVNTVLSSGIHPENLKICKVIPIFKKRFKTFSGQL